MGRIKRYWVLAWDDYYPNVDNVQETFVRREDAEAFAMGLRIEDPWESTTHPQFETELELNWYEKGLRWMNRYDNVRVHDMLHSIYEDAEEQ